MDFSGLLTGTIAGFNRQRNVIDEQNRADAEEARKREATVYTALLNSEDPDAQALGAAGMLHSTFAPKRKGGLQGWLGEMQASPVMPQIQALLRTPKTITEDSTTLPSTQYAGQIAEMPGEQPAALPSTSPTEVGAPPPTAPQSAVKVTQQPAVTTQTQRQVPRHLFPTTEDRYQMEATGRARGQISERRAQLEAVGATPDEIKQTLMQEFGGRHGASSAVQFQHVPVELPDGSQRLAVFDRGRGQYVDPDTQQPITGAKPLTHTASTSYGKDFEIAAKALGFSSGAQVTSPVDVARVQERIQQTKSVMLPSQALTQAQHMLPNATLDSQLALADALMSSTRADAVGTPPPAAAAAPAQAGAPPTTTPPTAPTTGAPPAAGLKGKVGAALPAGALNQTKDTGKPPSPQIAENLAKTKATNDLIDSALKALEPYKSDNTLDGSLRLARNYREGYASVEGAVGQLSDLAALQASNSPALMGSSRALRYYTDKRQHMPRLPSGRQTDAGKYLSGSSVGTLSRWMPGHGDDSGFDTPQQMYEKLLRAKTNNENYIRELSTASEAPAGTAPPGAEASGGAYQDAQGNWHIR